MSKKTKMVGVKLTENLMGRAKISTSLPLFKKLLATPKEINTYCPKCKAQQVSRGYSLGGVSPPDSK